MAILQINRNPSTRDLRQFAISLVIFSGLIGGLLLWKGRPLSSALWIWIPCVSVAAIGWVILPILRVLYLTLITLTYPIGWVVSHVVFAVVYYGVFTPIGLLMRAFGRDPMMRRFDPEAKSYWIRRSPAPEPARYFRQF